MKFILLAWEFLCPMTLGSPAIWTWFWAVFTANLKRRVISARPESNLTLDIFLSLTETRSTRLESSNAERGSVWVIVYVQVFQMHWIWSAITTKPRRNWRFCERCNSTKRTGLATWGRYVYTKQTMARYWKKCTLVADQRTSCASLSREYDPKNRLSSWSLISCTRQRSM